MRRKKNHYKIRKYPFGDSVYFHGKNVTPKPRKKQKSEEDTRRFIEVTEAFIESKLKFEEDFISWITYEN